MNGQVLFSDDSYRVEATTARPGSPYVVAFSMWDKDFHPVTAGPFSRVFARDAVVGLGYNSVEIISSRNDWYQGDSLREAVAAARQFLAGARVVTYGCSMGGFAAINFSNALNADAFVALSPQFSIAPDWLAGIGDARWAHEASLLGHRHDRIADGSNAGSYGLILYDDQHRLDRPHAEACARQTRGTLVAIPCSGHPVSLILNQTCGLKSVIAEVCQALAASPADDLPAALARGRDAFLARHRQSFFHLFCQAPRIPDLGLAFLGADNRAVTADALLRHLGRFLQDPPHLAALMLCYQVLDENIAFLGAKPAISRKLLDRLADYHRRHGFHLPARASDWLPVPAPSAAPAQQPACQPDGNA